MRKVKIFLVSVCLILIVPFNCYAAMTHADVYDADINTYTSDLSNFDFTSLWQQAASGNKCIFVFYNTIYQDYRIYVVQSQYYYSNYNEDIRFPDSANDYFSFTDGVNYADMYQLQAGGSRLTNLNFSTNQATNGYKLLALYSFIHPNDSTYYRYGNYSTRTNASNLNLPFHFNSSGSLVDSENTVLYGSGSSGSGSESGGTVDMTRTNNLLVSIGEKLDDIFSYVSYIKLHMFTGPVDLTPVTNKLELIRQALYDSDGYSVVDWLEGIGSTLDDVSGTLTDIKSQLGSYTTPRTVLNYLNSMKGTLNDMYTSIGSNLSGLLTTKFETLNNVILYGNPNGNDEYQQERLELQQRQTQLDSLNTRLQSAPQAINTAADDVSSYIDTFTTFYNGFTALNVAITSVLYFAFAIIFIKKVIGR